MASAVPARHRRAAKHNKVIRMVASQKNVEWDGAGVPEAPTAPDVAVEGHLDEQPD